METFGNQIQQNSAFKFFCDIFHHGTNRKYNYEKHIISLRHTKLAKMETDGNQIQQI